MNPTREHPTGDPRQTPEDPRPEHPARAPRATPEDPADRKMNALTYRTARSVYELVTRSDVEPRFLDETLLELEALGLGARATLRNTIRELEAAGILTVKSSGRGDWHDTIISTSPLGRAWLLGAIDPKIYPVPTLQISDGPSGLVLRWNRPVAPEEHYRHEHYEMNPNPTTQEVSP